jgi:hypothetical protein
MYEAASNLTWLPISTTATRKSVLLRRRVYLLQLTGLEYPRLESTGIEQR